MAWRGGLQILEEEEERKEWEKHWQCDTEVQYQENKPWRNEKPKKLEEDLPRLKESDFAKAARILQNTNRSKVEQCGRWPQQACTTMFFLIPVADCAYSYHDSFVGSSESARGGEMATEISC